MRFVEAKEILKVRTGKFDANHAKENGKYSFFTCALKPFKTNTFSFNDEVIILPGNGANVGEVLYFNGKFEAYQRTYVLHEINAEVKYIFYFFKKYWIRQITKKQVGSATNYIKMDDILSFKIPLPPLKSQQKIATILDEADKLRRLDKKLIKKYEQLSQSLFLEMFGDPVSNSKQWKIVTVREMIKSAKYGTSLKASEIGEFPYLRMNNITYNGYMDYSNLKYINVDEKNKGKYLAKKGDILFNRTNSKELVGKTGIFELDEEMILAGYIIRLRVNEKTNPYFLWSFLNSRYAKQTLFSMCKSIVGMANINAQEVQKIQIYQPPIKLQNKFADLIQEIENQKAQALRALEDSEDLFNSLLQRAFKGNL